MAVRKAEKARAEAEKTTVDLEPRVVALAEQLGGFLGRVQAKADGWLDNEALRNQVAKIRDGAADLLKHVNRASAAARASATNLAPPKRQGREGEKPAPAAEAAAAPTPRASRGPVDAPGKRHRKPPPQERIDKRMGEPVGKKMGQKQFKVGKSRGRG